MSARKYEQRIRAQTAEETRRRILDAVSTQLREKPAQRVSLDNVARQAEVSRSTIYQVFGSRGGLFDALGAEIRRTGGFGDVLRSFEQPDARQNLRYAIDGGVRMNLTNRDVLRALTSMAELDPDAVGDSVRRMNSGRVMGMRGLAERLDAQGILRDGVDVERATEMLWVLLSFETCDQLYSQRGLDVEATIALVTDMAEAAICEPESSTD